MLFFPANRFSSRKCKSLLLTSVGHENRAGDFYFPVVMTPLVSLVTDRDLFVFVNIYTMWFERIENRGVKKPGGGTLGLFIAPILSKDWPIY